MTAWPRCRSRSRILTRRWRSSSRRSTRCANARTATGRCWTAGTVDAKQLTELQHELETLERRQSSLEDSLLEVMERREELQSQQAGELAAIDELQSKLTDAQQALRRDARRDRSAATPIRLAARRTRRRIGRRSGRAVRTSARRAAGRAPGLLQGRRCGACRIEIDQGELARISAAAEDEVLRCPECGAILLRVKGIRQ